MTRGLGIVPVMLIVLAFGALALLGLNVISPVVSDLDVSTGAMDAELTDNELMDLFPEPAMAVEYNHISTHGLNKHPEASAIEKSCNKSIFQVWRDKYERKYYYVCKLADGKWGIIPVIVAGAEEIWKTGFSPGSGCWADTVRYLINTATRYNGVVK